MPPNAKASTWNRLKGRRGPTPAAPAGRVRVVSGSGTYFPRDAFGQKRPPTPVEKAAAYRNAVYCCAQINAAAVATQPLRLYCVTDAALGHKSPRCRTKALSRARERGLADNPGVSKRLAGVDRVDEVTDHPVLDLLDSVNPWFSRTQLFEATQLSIEVDGRWFWYWVPGPGGLPVEVWPLPPWTVQVLPDYVGTDVVSQYLFVAGGGQAELDRDRTLFGRELSLHDFYVQGYSWLGANYEHSQAYDKNIDYRDSVLTNRGRPDAMLIPTEEGGEVTADPDAIRRIQVEYEQTYSRGGAGRLWVPPGGMKLQPVSWSPQDMGELALSKSVLHDIARASGVPVPLVDGESANRANMDAALLQHARFCVRPRCRKLEEYLNSNFLPLWDDRLFLAFDDPVPADRVLEREDNRAYVDVLKTRNELRADMGLAPVDGGDELYLDGTKTPVARANEVIDLRVRQSREAPKPDEVPPDARAAEDEPAPEGEESHDDAFAEGDDARSDAAGKMLREGEQRRPFPGRGEGPPGPRRRGGDPAGGRPGGARGEHVSPPRWGADRA